MVLSRLILLIFILLILHQLFEVLFKKKIIEGAATQYQDPDLQSDPAVPCHCECSQHNIFERVK